MLHRGKSPGITLPVPMNVMGAPVLAGYSVLSVISAGAFGTVYRARDERRGRDVAIKSLHRLDPAAVLGLKGEFRAVARLTHPNLAEIYELARAESGWHLVMEYIAGRDMLAWIAASPRSGHAATKAFTQLATGVAALHAEGYLHGDLQPDNVLVTNDGRVVVCDFGAAVAMAAAPAAQHTLGAPAYLAPERLAGHAATEASDWYSVGAMIHEAITGAIPCEGPATRVTPAWTSALAQLSAELLATNPNERPKTPTILRRLGVTPAATFAQRSVFAGRTRELKLLQTCLQSATRGACLAARVRGPSGIGKSALLREFVRRCEQTAEPLVLVGRCHRHESVPYKALDAIVDTLAEHLSQLPDSEVAPLIPDDSLALSRVFPVLRRVHAIALPARPRSEPADAAAARQRGFAALQILLARVALRQPIVAIIDDAQWGDLDSARLLYEILTSGAVPHLLVITSHRTDRETQSEFVQALAPLQLHEDLTLGPLSALEVTSLVRAAGPHYEHLAHDRVCAIADECDGNPLLLKELLWDAGQTAQPRQPLAPSLDALVGRRLDSLDAEDRRVVNALAIAGSPLQHTTLRRAATLTGSIDRSLARLRHARLARVAIDDSERIEVYHERIRDAVLSRISATEAKQWHLQLATALVSQHIADPQAIAVHYGQAGKRALAVDYAMRAAARAETALAFERAAGIYRMAIEWSDGGSVQLHARLADALVNAGQGAEGARAFLVAANKADGTVSLDYRRRAAEQLLRAGHIDEGIESAKEVLGALGMAWPRSARSALASFTLDRIRLRIARRWPRRSNAAPPTGIDLQRIDAWGSLASGLTMVDLPRGIAFQTRYMLAARRTGDDSRVSRAMAVEGAQLATRPRSRTLARSLVMRAAATAAGTRDPRAKATAAGCAAMVEYQCGDFAAALATAQDALEFMDERCAGLDWERDTIELVALWSLYYLGDLAELDRRASALLRSARDRGDWYAETSLGVGLPALRWLARDETALGRDSISHAGAQWSRMDFHLQHLWAWSALVQLELYDRRTDAMLIRVEREWHGIRSSPLLRTESLLIETTDLRGRVFLAAATDRPDTARRNLRRATKAASQLRKSHAAWGRALGVLLDAGIACAAQAPDMLSKLETAQAHLSQVGLSVHAAAARRAHATRCTDRQQVAEIDRFLRARGIAEPSRFTFALLPVSQDKPRVSDS